MPFWTSKRVHDATAPKAGDGRPQHLDQVVRSLEAHAEGQDSQFAKLEARCHALEQALIETREALAAEAASRLALAARVRSFGLDQLGTAALVGLVLLEVHLGRA